LGAETSALPVRGYTPPMIVRSITIRLVGAVERSAEAA